VVSALVLRRWPGPITPEYAERVWGDRDGRPNPPADDARPTTA
jgi:hypothetical protein